MSIYRCFVREQQLLVRAVRDCHDIDVLEFGTGLAPIAMRQNVMPADFTAGLDLAVRRHRPMKQSVKARDPHPARRWLDVFEKGREPPDDFSRVQFVGHAIKFFQRNASFIRARRPWRRLNFVRPEFTLQREQHFPLQFAEINHLHRNHPGRLGRFASRLNRFAANMAHTEREDPSGRHDTKMFCANFSCEQICMLPQRKSMRHFQRRPKFVIRAGGDCIGRAQHHMTGKWIALEHPIERIVDLVRGNFPGHERAIGKIGREQSLPDTANRAGVEHGRDPRHHSIDIYIRAPCNFLEWLAHEAFNFVLRYGENLCVDRVVVLHRQHVD